MSREPQKARLDAVNADNTSNLELILDLIMPYLSTRDCVRTSILSSKWRHRWTTVPNLVFDENCHPRSLIDSSKKYSRALASIINGVLLRHKGSIQILQIKDVCIIPDIDYWILRASEGPITTFVLEICHMEHRYKLPSSLYTFRSLVNLKLVNCILRPPSYFDGFKKLKCLQLDFVTLIDDVFENLISSCPLLEKLAVISFQGLVHLKIDAQNLQFIRIDGAFENITFVSELPRLSIFSIYLSDGARISNYEEASLTELFMKLPNIQRFVLKDYSIKYLSYHPIPESTPFQCKDLYHLAIFNDFGDTDDSLAFFYVLRSSPNLTELEIETLADNESDKAPIWGDTEKCIWVFEKLRLVKLDNFCWTRAELSFVKFVLGNSPVLEKMSINPCQGLEMEFDILEAVLSYEKVSSDAEIIFEVQWDDRNPWSYSESMSEGVYY